jgi:tetratricopeptide (TPR) repeat protein
VTTPADSPFPNTEAFKIDGKLSSDGTLESKIEDTTRGDSEVILRTAFRQVPEPEWKDLVQRISYGMGFAGTVSDIGASKPETIGEPFHFSYSYNRKDYPDWKSDHRITVPGMPFYLPPVRDDAGYPVWLGPPVEAVSDSKVELPQGYKPQVPSKVDLKYDFAEYHASYSQDGGVLTAKRRLLIKLREVPVAEFDDYRSFIKNLQNDVNRYVYTTSSSAAVIPDAPVPTITPSFVRGLMGLPDSDSSNANQLEADARSEMTSHDLQGAVSSLHRAVAEDPRFTRAWVLLGMLLLSQQQYPEAAEAYEAAMKMSGVQPDLQASLASVYLLAGEREKAAAAFTKLAEVDPKGNTFNDVAYQMANADLKLPLALNYANKAVRDAEEESQKITLPDLKVEDLKEIFRVAAYWDTLGWVNERMSNLEQAELYLRASWKLTQDCVVAGHLCHLYKRTHKTALAIQMCRMAIYRMPITGRGDMSQFQTEMAAAQDNLKYLDRQGGQVEKIGRCLRGGYP